MYSTHAYEFMCSNCGMWRKWNRTYCRRTHSCFVWYWTSKSLKQKLTYCEKQTTTMQKRLHVTGIYVFKLPTTMPEEGGGGWSTNYDVTNQELAEKRTFLIPSLLQCMKPLFLFLYAMTRRWMLQNALSQDQWSLSEVRLQPKQAKRTWKQLRHY
jgi:hypothetical protein